MVLLHLGGGKAIDQNQIFVLTRVWLMSIISLANIFSCVSILSLGLRIENGDWRLGDGIENVNIGDWDLGQQIGKL